MTEYKKEKLLLTNGQQKKLTRAIKHNCEISFLLNKNSIGRGGNVDLYLTERQINKTDKAKAKIKGIKLTISRAQIRKLRENDDIHVGSGAPSLYKPPPFIGNWEKKKMIFKNVPLSNHDLNNWCKQLNIKIKGIF